MASIEPIVTDSVLIRLCDMRQYTTDEVGSTYALFFVVAAAMIEVTKSDPLSIKGKNTMITDRSALEITREVFRHALPMSVGRLNTDVPMFLLQ